MAAAGPVLGLAPRQMAIHPTIARRLAPVSAMAQPTRSPTSSKGTSFQRSSRYASHLSTY
eukprot:4962199-Alexandrium_andersonii.AAC.1